MSSMHEHFPDLEGDEFRYVSKVMERLSDEDQKSFKVLYRARRKDPTLILVLTIIGFFGAAGIHRFFVGHIGMGILYFFTAGLCLIGTIVDAINYQNLAFEYNRKKAQEILEQLS